MRRKDITKKIIVTVLTIALCMGFTIPINALDEDISDVQTEQIVVSDEEVYGVSGSPEDPADMTDADKELSDEEPDSEITEETEDDFAVDPEPIGGGSLSDSDGNTSESQENTEDFDAPKGEDGASNDPVSVDEEMIRDDEETEEPLKKADIEDAQVVEKALSEQPSVTIRAEKNKAEASFVIIASSEETDLSLMNLKAAVWKKKNKSDLIWYEMKRRNGVYKTGNINLTDFLSASGTYKAEVHAWNKEGGDSSVLGTVEVTMKESNGTVQFEDKYAGEKNQEEKVFRLSAHGIAKEKGVKKVEFLVWPKSDFSKKEKFTAKRSASGVYYANIPVTEFKLTGQYQCHAYITDNKGSEKRCALTDIWTISKTLKYTMKCINKEPAEGKFTAAFSDWETPSGIRSVKFDIWSEKDKSDLRTYETTKSAKGNYRARVNIRNHNYNVGEYHVSAAVVCGNGVQKTVESTVTFDADNLVFITQPEFGRRIVGIDNPSPSSDIRFAVWSDKGGKDDLIWYKGTNSGKKWSADVNLEKFANTGDYSLDIYSGSRLIKHVSFKVQSGESLKNGWFIENGYRYYYFKGVKQKDLRGFFQFQTIRICVNRQQCTVNAYTKGPDGSFNTPIAAFACSVGNPWTPTPLGTYHPNVRSRWCYFKSWNCWAQYAVKIVGGKFFHSVAGIGKSSYNIDPNEYNKLGSPASHGCVRLTVRDSKWIYENMYRIESVVVYDSANPGPFGKGTAPKTNTNYDPTDPAVRR